MQIQTNWEYSQDSEARRILQIAHQMSVGFYRINNFYVLPYSQDSKYAPATVLFPDLPYNQIPRFWDKARQVDGKILPVAADDKLIRAVWELISENISLKEPAYSQAKKTWGGACEKILAEILKIMPDKKNRLKKIIIYPTVLGTGASFSFSPTSSGVLHVYLREDRNIYSITESILTSLTRKEVYDELEGDWSQSELLVDWLLTKSSLAKVLGKYETKNTFVPTIKAARTKQRAKLLKESDDFYKKLGLPTTQKVFRLNGEVPIVNDKPIENLTWTENLILRLLIEKANNVASFDELGDILFKTDDNFSLYAISKQIERLRNKLEKNGVSASYIQTLRGRGYVLKN